MTVANLVVIGINLLISAALWGLGMLLRRPKHTEGPKSDREVQISTYGAPLRLLYGECKTAMELIWCPKLEEIAKTEEVGKGGGDTYTSYIYRGSWAGVFGIAPDQAVFGELQLLKLWQDEKLILNLSDDNDKITFKSEDIQFGPIKQVGDHISLGNADIR